MQKKQNISFLSCWHDGKGMAKGWCELVNRQRLTHKGTGYDEGTFKVFRSGGGGVNPQKS
jgi:hypothetical protein